MKSKYFKMAFYQAILIGLAESAHATGAGLAYEGTLNSLASSMTDPVTKAMLLIAIIGSSIGVAMTEGGSGMRKLFWILVAGSIACSAAAIVTNFLGYSGGATF